MHICGMAYPAIHVISECKSLMDPPGPPNSQRQLFSLSFFQDKCGKTATAEQFKVLFLLTLITAALGLLFSDSVRCGTSLQIKPHLLELFHYFLKTPSSSFIQNKASWYLGFPVGFHNLSANASLMTSWVVYARI